jgi:hypothetical protein
MIVFDLRPSLATDAPLNFHLLEPVADELSKIDIVDPMSLTSNRTEKLSRTHAVEELADFEFESAAIARQRLR